MKSRLSYYALLLVGLVWPASRPVAAQPAPGFFFHDGDRVQMTGDSITNQRMYSTLVESYVLSRFPQWNITFRNTGWVGDTMGLTLRGGIDAGYTRDMEPLHSTAVTINYGMNDGRDGVDGLPVYTNNASLLADKFQANGTRVAFLTSSPVEKYEPEQPAGASFNTMLRSYAEGLATAEASKGVPCIDELNPMIAAIEAGRQANVLASTADGPRLTKDNVHPLWGGHLIIATNTLKGLQAPALVSRVTLDARNGTSVNENASVSSVHLDDTLTFTRTDGALPWPISSDANIALALQLPGFTPLDDLSHFDLQIDHLLEARYEVDVDGIPIGTYTREQLTAGANMAGATSGPIYTQTQALLNKIIEKNNLFFKRWYTVQLAPLPPGEDAQAQRDAQLLQLDQQIAAAEAAINPLRQPRPHVWTVKPLPATAPVSSAPTAKVTAHWQGTDVRDMDGKYLTNQPLTLQVTFADADGLSDLHQGFILLGANQELKNAFYLRYNREDNSLSLRNDANDGWVGTLPFGSPGSLANSQGRLLMDNSSIQIQDGTATLSFEFIPFDGLAGTRPIWLRASDSSVTTAWSSNVTIGLNKWGNVKPVVQEVRHADDAGSSGVYAVDAPVHFTAAFGDDNGVTDLTSYFLTIGATSTRGPGLTLRFDPGTRLLYLLDETGKIWLGGYQPGSENLLENSRGQIDMRGVSIGGTSTRVKLNFTLTPKPAFAGSYHLWAEARDAAAKTSGIVDEGAISFTTGEPTPTPEPTPTETPEPTPTPSSQPPLARITAHWQGDDVRDTDGKYLTGQPLSIQAQFSDADGLSDLVSGDVLLGSNQALNNAFCVRYNRADGTLSLLNDSGDGWVGSGAPGGSAVLSNTQGILLLKYCNVQDNGSGVTLTLVFVPSASLTGARPIWTRAADTSAPTAWSGPVNISLNTWGNIKPVAQEVSHADSEGPDGQYPVNQPVSCTAKFGDDNGVMDLKSCFFTIGATSAQGAGLTLRYDPPTDLLYLLDDTGKLWLGGYHPGTPNTLENSKAQVDLTGASVTGNPTRLVLSFPVTVKPAFAGAYHIWCEVRDAAGKTSGVQDKGPVRLTAPAAGFRVKSGRSF